MSKKECLTDKVNLSRVRYYRANSKEDKAIVTLVRSSKSLYFNPKMVHLLDIADWKQVIVGYDKDSKITVLKHCDAEEYGAVMVRVLTATAPRTAHRIKRASESRIISVGHLIRSSDFESKKISRHYKAECEGTMIFLEAIEE